MWSSLAPYLGLAVALVLVSGFFSGSEVALFALRRIDREQMLRSGRAADRLVLSLLGQPRRLIATVLIGNEVVNATVAAIAVIVAGESLPQAHEVAIGGIAVAVAVPVLVLFGEVTAKTLALKAPVGWARASARLLWLFALLIAPLRWFIQMIAELLLRPIGPSRRPDRDLSEEEFRTLVDAGSAQGQVDQRERRIIHRVFEFSDKSVGQVMTPREKIVALSYDLPMSRLVKEVAQKGFSRVPIYQRSLDNVRGILNAKDLVPATAGAAPRTLAELLHEPLFVPRATPIKRLFRIFKQKKVHLAMVVNEYGKVLGLVTMDDLLSQLFGAIRDEREGQQKAALRRGRLGRTPVPGQLTTVTPEDTPVPGESPSVMAEIAPQEAGADLSGYDAEVTPPPVEVPVEPAAAAPAAKKRATTHDDDDDDDDGDEPPPDAPVPVTEVTTGPSGPVPREKR